MRTVKYYCKYNRQPLNTGWIQQGGSVYVPTALPTFVQVSYFCVQAGGYGYRGGDSLWDTFQYTASKPFDTLEEAWAHTAKQVEQSIACAQRRLTQAQQDIVELEKFMLKVRVRQKRNSVSV